MSDRQVEPIRGVDGSFVMSSGSDSGATAQGAELENDNESDLDCLIGPGDTYTSTEGHIFKVWSSKRCSVGLN